MRTNISTNKTNKLFVISSFLTLLLFRQAYAETYFVSPNGSNSNTGLSLSAPFKTIKYALRQTEQSGDTVYVTSGTYHETLFIWQDGITLSAYKNDKPVIDGKTTLPNEDWGALIGIGGDNNTVSGFELKNSNIKGHYLGGYGVDVTGHHNRISKMNVHHTWEHGILIHGDYNIVEDSTIWQAAFRNSFNDGRIRSGWSAGLSAARNHSSTALIPGLNSYTILRRNTAYNNWGEGITCYEADHCTMEDNVAYDNWTVNLYLSDATNSLVQRNLAYVSSEPAIPVWEGRYMGILLADEAPAVPRAANNKIINNLVYNSSFDAYTWSEEAVINPGLKNVLIANNTIIGGRFSIGGVKEKMVNINTRIENNIFTGKDNHISDMNGVAFSNNNWTAMPKLVALSKDFSGDPQVARKGSTMPGLLTPAFFKLLKNSPAINAAKPLNGVNKDFFKATRGSLPDIGALEFVGDSPVIIDTAAPSAPSSLLAIAKSSSSVELSWGSSVDNEGVAGYIVYRNGVEINTGTDTRFTDNSVTANTSYSYAVKAFDAAENLSISSNTVQSSTPPAKVAVKISSRFAGNRSVEGITIGWTTNIPSTGTVYYGTSADDLNSQVRVSSLATKHSVRITGLTKRTKYYYTIEVNDGVSSANSRVARFRTARFRRISRR